MKMTKKITALLLALVMALSLSTMAFADGTTTTTTGKVTRTTVNSIDAVSSVTIGGTTAYYEKDSNTGDQIYIRAMVAGGSEYSLKSTNVVINLSNAGATINGDLAFTGAGNVRTATNVNLLNKVYTVIISTSEGGVTTSKTYKLAAGLPSGAVSIDGNDPLRIVSIVVGDERIMRSPQPTRRIPLWVILCRTRMASGPLSTIRSILQCRPPPFPAVR